MVDVAREAGVSLATVDRVVNGRIGVGASTAKRVSEVMKRLDFIPDSAASMLRRPRLICFDLILPKGENAFIAQVAEVASSLRLEFGGLQVGARAHWVEGFDVSELASALERMGAVSQGIGFIALDHPAVRSAVAEVVGRGVPVVTIISDLPASPRIGYVGVDNRAAGRCAGDLMGRFLGARTGCVLPIAGSFAYRGHEEREAGFRSILKESYPSLKVLSALEGFDHGNQSASRLEAILDETKDLIGIYNIGGGNRIVGAALADRTSGSSDIVYIGHDLTAHTRRWLLQGVMDAAIVQDPAAEVRGALSLLASAHASYIPKDEAFVKIEIITRENLPQNL